MTISHEFNYSKERTLKKVLADLSAYKSKAAILAGGTDLVNLLKEDNVTPEVLVDIKDIPELKEILFEDDMLTLGSTVTFSDIIESRIINEHFPLFVEMASRVASHGIRNRATIGGNICSAAPCCDSGPILLVYDAEVILKSTRSARTLPLKSFFTGPKETALQDDELLFAIKLRKPPGPHGGAFLKLRRYKGKDLSQASVCVLALPGREYKVAFGAVAPTPIISRKIETQLKGGELNSQAIAKAVSLVPGEISPITDIRASKEYREHMVRVMLQRGLKAAQSRLRGKGPDYGVESV